VAFSYFHVDVIDTMGTPTITINIRKGLIKIHVEFIKKGFFFIAGKLDCEGQNNYDKGNFDWTIELCTSTKMTTISTFDPLVKLHFLPKTQFVAFPAICSSPLLQPPLFLLSLECVVKLIASLSYQLLTGAVQKTFKL
jgi:hypothetical protein